MLRNALSSVIIHEREKLAMATAIWPPVSDEYLRTEEKKSLVS